MRLLPAASGGSASIPGHRFCTNSGSLAICVAMRRISSPFVGLEIVSLLYGCI